jgi:hypothetical protein
MSDCFSSILPICSAKAALLRKGLLNRAIHRKFHFSSCISSNVERAITDMKMTCSDLTFLLQRRGFTSVEIAGFMAWLEQWLMRMVYRDGNPLSRDKCAMGQALAVCLYRCADARDYEVAEQLVLRHADLEQRWEGGTALMHVAADVHNGIEHSKGCGSRARMVELLLFHRANVNSRLECRY